MKNLFLIIFIFCLTTSCSDEHETEGLKNLNFDISKVQSTSQTTHQNQPLKSSQEESDPNLLYQDDMFLGDTNSSTRVIFFFSTTCPACAYFFKTIIPQIKSEFADNKQILFIFREIISSPKELLASILARSMDNVEDYMNIMNIILANQREWALSKKYYDFFLNIAISYSQNKNQFEERIKDENLKQALFSKSFNMQKKFFTGYIPIFIIDGKIFDMNQYKNYQSLKQEILRKININLTKNKAKLKNK